MLVALITSRPSRLSAYYGKSQEAELSSACEAWQAFMASFPENLNSLTTTDLRVRGVDLAVPKTC